MMNTTGKNAAIVGIGLLGSSLGMALKNSGYLRSGWTRRPAVTQWALEHDVIDRGYSTPEEVFSEADILILCVPIPQIIEYAERYSRFMKPGAILTDIGSVKTVIEEAAVSAHARYVGGHPMAGTEKTGPENGFPTLYANADVFIVPPAHAEEEDVMEVERLWRSIGTKTTRIDAAAHDDLVAHTSHLTHIVASALTLSTLDVEAESKKQLDADTETLLTIGRKKLCQFSVLKFQQMDGLNTALPIGHRKIPAVRTLTSESVAVLMPFRVQEIMDAGGIYCGENAISHNLIMCNKEKLLNPNSFLLGVPGSGKSFNAKMQIVFLALATQDDILICDPEREYASLVEAMGGEVVRIAAGSRDHINAMDMVDGYGDGGDPVIEKSQFILSLFEQLDKKGINAKERSIIDRCVGEVYEEYQHGGAVPTLRVLREKFLEQEEPEAQDLALVSELFTNGSLDAFAHESNVDVNNRIMVYDILDLGKQLKTMGLLVITDAMLNRVTENWKQGKRTHIFLDEFHVVFENEYSGAFFNSAWRRFRKRNAFPTAITQNVEYLLDSVLASTMISNSEYIVMLNQAEPDRAKLATLLNISTEQMGYITNADAGCGLVKYGSSLVPFVNRFPTNTRLYKLMTTKPGEDSINRGRM